MNFTVDQWFLLGMSAVALIASAILFLKFEILNKNDKPNNNK